MTDEPVTLSTDAQQVVSLGRAASPWTDEAKRRVRDRLERVWQLPPSNGMRAAAIDGSRVRAGRRFGSLTIAIVAGPCVAMAMAVTLAIVGTSDRPADVTAESTTPAPAPHRREQVTLDPPPRPAATAAERSAQVRGMHSHSGAAPLTRGSDEAPDGSLGGVMPTAIAPEPPAPAPISDNLGAEQAILETARLAAASADWQRALDIVAQHERVFPDGQMTEEREGLAIQALANLGRKDSARGRAAEFRVRFPRSIQWPAIEAVLDSMP